jgi:hypothetical protein
LDIEPLLDRLRAISNEALLIALHDHHLAISDEKFSTAFQCIGACYDLGRPDIDFRGPPDMSSDVIRGHRLRASVVFMIFTALCYMRSEHLERGLDDVPENSPLRAFRDLYRSGCVRKGDDTLVQHIRNSMAHGTFQVCATPEVAFTDRTWTESLTVAHLMELCEHVHRLYHEAFSGSVPRPSHWSRFGTH